ncbi:AAA family ATPase [Pontibacillus salicampi]|uniref:AAA family ATPase n=1 Tax=Pontibacillus salicampi TaxID=1449801 RepID=A0ABV6LKP9_9BACI
MLKQIALKRENITSFQQYPFDIPAIRSMDTLPIRKPITFFVGENGAGKSTLLEAIADRCDFHTAGGGRNNTYDVHASESALGNYIRLSWLPKVTRGFFLRAESFYQFASYIEGIGLEAYGGQSLHAQSHGESFLSLFLNRFQGDGPAIYLLDEPEAALSPARQLTFLRVLRDLAEFGNAQFIIATHSPILLGYPDADIWSFDGEEICNVHYEETEHYTITNTFLQNRERVLKELFSDEG